MQAGFYASVYRDISDRCVVLTESSILIGFVGIGRAVGIVSITSNMAVESSMLRVGEQVGWLSLVSSTLILCWK